MDHWSQNRGLVTAVPALRLPGAGSIERCGGCGGERHGRHIAAPAGQGAGKLHGRRGLEVGPGFFRLGTESFAILARAKESLPPLLRRLGLRHRVEPVRLSRGRRAWRKLTAGILVARAVYGEEVKRWYMRGLPETEKMRWDVVKKAMQKPWRRRTGARVRTGKTK